MRWFDELSPTVRAAIITIITTLLTSLLNHGGITAPPATVVNTPAAQVTVNPAPGAPMMATPAAK
jgi:hypothetical protein